MCLPHELLGEPWRDFPQKHLCLAPCVEVVHLFQPTSYAQSQLCWSDTSTELEYLEWGSAHTTPKECYKVALFLQLGLSSTQIRHNNGAFRKRSSNWRNLKTPASRLCVDGKHFQNRTFSKQCRHDNYVIYWPSLPQKQIQNTGDCWDFNIVRRSVDGKHLMRFQSETSVFKFLLCSEDGVWNNIDQLGPRDFFFC